MALKVDSEWVEIVRTVADKRGVKWEAVGGLNPVGAPLALCPGGSNRLTGKLGEDFWGASCDAQERVEGRFRSKRIVPGALLIKAHFPDLADAMSPFNVESIERNPGDMIDRISRKRVQFESIEFNRKFIATVPIDHDPVALRELIGPGFLDWAAHINNRIDFGMMERQMYVTWTLDSRDVETYERALDTAGELFRRVAKEVQDEGKNIYPPGPWHAGLEPFPAS